MKKKYLVTGSAGFIGYHLSKRLLELGHEVVGLDNLNNYYSVELKKARNQKLIANPNYKFHLGQIQDKQGVVKLFQENDFDTVFHLAAQAGVRYSLENPETYIETNIDGTLTFLEAARFCKGTKPHLLLASSSSVYGLSQKLPFREDDAADRPAAVYGATKRADELLGHAYAHLFALKVTMLRFFSVYGPWGRPDMALFKFVKNILNNEEIEVYNNGDMIRDFTYVSDIVDGILGLDVGRRNSGQPNYDVYNIGCGRSRSLIEFITAIEKALGKKAKMKMMPFQAGDVHRTLGDTTKLKNLCGYEPKVQIEEGVRHFVEWYKEFYQES